MKKRKIGVEYLRIVSMLLIVANHFLLFTGVLDNVKPFTISYYIVWLLEAIGYVPGVESYSEIFYSHSSIFVIGSAVALFMLFKDKQNRDTRFEKWILKISPLTFGVYLIHMNANLAKIYWGQLKYSLDANSYGIFLWYIVSTVIVFGISTIIDQIRNIGVKQIKNIFMRK